MINSFCLGFIYDSKECYRLISQNLILLRCHIGHHRSPSHRKSLRNTRLKNLLRGRMIMMANGAHILIGFVIHGMVMILTCHQEHVAKRLSEPTLNVMKEEREKELHGQEKKVGIQNV